MISVEHAGKEKLLKMLSNLKTLSLPAKLLNYFTLIYFDELVVDDYNRWTWVKFLITKDEAYDVFSTFCTQVQTEKELKNL